MARLRGDWFNGDRHVAANLVQVLGRSVNSIQIFGEVVRVNADSKRSNHAYAEVVCVGTYSQTPPQFTLVAYIASYEMLMACQPGDLVLATGKVTFGNKSGEYKVSVTDIQRLVFNGEEPPPEPPA